MNKCTCIKYLDVLLNLQTKHSKNIGKSLKYTENIFKVIMLHYINE